jgi:AcrR family transcriptional regulator
MGRLAKFDSDQILDVTTEIVAEVGPGLATVARIAERLGGPTGSIYHRFESRELLFARLWTRTVRRAQQGFLAALAIEDIEAAAVDAALHIPRWSRDHLAEATVLLLYRRQDLAERWPAELGAELADINTDVRQALRDFTRRRFGRITEFRLQTVTFALVDVPYGASRRHLLAGKPPPLAVDDLVVQTCRCTLLGRDDAADL